MAAASDNVYNLNPAFNVKRTPSTRRQVDVLANTAILTQLVAQLELSKVSLRKETPLVQLIDRPILPLEKEKLGRVKTFLLGCFGDDSSDYLDDSSLDCAPPRSRMGSDSPG